MKRRPLPLIPLPAGARHNRHKKETSTATGKVEKFEEEDGAAGRGLHCPGFSSRKEEIANMFTKINMYLLMPALSGCDCGSGREGANV